MAHEEPKIRIETREELIYLLAEAAAIEHNLMCCYLYAAWSLKRGERDGLTPSRRRRSRAGSGSITLGRRRGDDAPHARQQSARRRSAARRISRGRISRSPPGYHPSGVVVELGALLAGGARSFHLPRAPRGKGTAGRRPSSSIRPTITARMPKARLMPSAQDYSTVGHLYRGIRHGLDGARPPHRREGAVLRRPRRRRSGRAMRRCRA